MQMHLRSIFHRKQVDQQSQVHFRPLKRRLLEVGKVPVGERRIDGGISQLHEKLIDRLCEMTDVTIDERLGNEVVSIFDPQSFGGHFLQNSSEFVAPSKDYLIDDHNATLLMIDAKIVHFSLAEQDPFSLPVETNVVRIDKETIRSVKRGECDRRIRTFMEGRVVVASFAFATVQRKTSKYTKA